ncbi:hypothetical protein [Modestobacter roseus]|uniref:Htaa protein n=1 Tax=Modestobacter roseus TaxID=1181884 RepID=A0A562IR47_9ACTN|nr:hypothetical protein [Modestobacter roseus]MQA34460.1 hypothetical protein [Modestobacter roseus]TWH73054.1 hypothetical protein JD78_01577 [Modestobacter roseus]
MTVRRRLLPALLAACLLLVGAVALAVPAQAAARVTVANEFGAAAADTTYSTPITVRGTGFQSVAGGFGGIYVLFGWVDDPGGGWRPSQGGQTGADYRYVPDSESADNAGFQRFVAFPGSATAEEANGGVLAADGSWSVQMYVPGPTFSSLDRDGQTVSVDCRQVTCGVLTIGAHGVVNAANETFTPVTFTDVYTEAPAGAPSAGGGGGDGAGPGADAPASAAPAPAAPAPGTAPPPPSGPPAVTIDPATAVAGRVLSFTATGLVAGEQVLATLDDGLASVGPLPVSAQGTVAGLLELPETVPGGNHELRLTGTTTGGLPTVTFSVQSDAGALSVAEVADSTPTQPAPAALAFFFLAALVFFVVLTAAVTRRRARRAVTVVGGR